MSLSLQTGTQVTAGDSSGSLFVRGKDSAGSDLAVLRNGAIGSPRALMKAWKAANTGMLPVADRMGNIGINQWVPMHWGYLTGSQGATINSIEFPFTTSVFASVVAGCSSNMTGTTSTSSGSHHILTTNQRYSGFGYPVRGSATARADISHGSVAEIGFFVPFVANPGIPGPKWIFGSDGSITPQVIYDGSASSAAAISIGSDIVPALNVLGDWRRMFLEWVVEWWPDAFVFSCVRPGYGDVISRQRIGFAKGQARFANLTRLPWSVRVFNNSVFLALSGPQFATSEWHVSTLRGNRNAPWESVAAGQNQGSAWQQGGTQSANYSNSAAPASGTRSNSAAAYTTLAGQWQFAAVASAEQDNSWFAFANPAPWQFCCTGVTIDAINMGAANSATVPTVMQWFLSPSGNTANLLGVAHSRIALGLQEIPINAAIGQRATNSINVRFDSPHVCDPGRQFVLAMKNVSGAATASQVVRGVASFNGYFE